MRLARNRPRKGHPGGEEAPEDEEPKERRRLMDWEKNYGYEDSESDSDEEEGSPRTSENRVVEEFTTAKHHHSNRFVLGRVNLGFMSTLQLWAERILKWVGARGGGGGGRGTCEL